MKYKYGNVRGERAVTFSTASLKGKTQVNLDKSAFINSTEYVEIKDKQGKVLLCRTVAVLAGAEDRLKEYYTVPLSVFREIQSG